MKFLDRALAFDSKRGPVGNIARRQRIAQRDRDLGVFNSWGECRQAEGPLPARDEDCRIDRLVAPRPTNGRVERVGEREPVICVGGFERDGLLLFALAALIGGGVLVGQALVRSPRGDP